MDVTWRSYILITSKGLSCQRVIPRKDYEYKAWFLLLIIIFEKNQFSQKIVIL